MRHLRNEKSEHLTHLNKTDHDTTVPFQLIYVDDGAYIICCTRVLPYVSKITDQHTKWKEMSRCTVPTIASRALVTTRATFTGFTIEYDAEAIVHLAKPMRSVRFKSFPQDCVSNVSAICTDGGGDYTACSFEKYCLDTGITHEYAVTATPYQAGVSGRDERTWNT